MKALVEGFMSRQPVAWALFGAGAVITLMLEMLAVPSLIFALGMYLPLELNSPALVGGVLSHYLNRRAERRNMPFIRERAVVIASGLMAGGALGGVLGAACRLIPGYSETWVETPFYGNDAISQSISGLMFAGFCAYIWFASQRAPKGTHE
jgi:uncharacterized oligopeptide transporter (OPT) family protein